MELNNTMTNQQIIKEKIIETENDPYLHDYVIQKKIRKILTENIDWKVFTIEELADQIFGLFKKERAELLKKIEKAIVDRLPSFPPKNKAREIGKMKLFSAEDIEEIIKKLL